MRKTFLALSCLALILLAALILGAGLGVAQTSQPVKDARPTPTPELPLPAVPPVSPESPEIPPLPDLIVESIEVKPFTPVIGQATRVRVVIKNRGTKAVTPGNNFWSDLYVDPAVVPIQLGQDGVYAWPCQATWLPVGGSYILETEYTFDDVKSFALYAQVDTDGHVAESNENNNVFGPIIVNVEAPHKFVHQTHEDFQLGVASTLDASDPEGVIRRGLFVEPETDPEIYHPDSQIDQPPLPPSHPNNVIQVKPALAIGGAGVLFAVWEDGRNGGVYNRDIYFSRSLDDGQTWSQPDVRINDDPELPSTANQASPDLAYDRDRNRLYAVWQDQRDGNYDIYFAYSDDGGDNWNPHPNRKLNDDVGTADQLNPSITVGTSRSGGDDRVYVVWQDQRNGNADVYLIRSDNGGLTWGPNYFVTDDPHMTQQDQAAPSVAVESMFGIVYVCWEDWRDSLHPEIYAMWSWDEGQTFGIDVPVTIVPPESRTTYRLQPSLAAHTTIELVEETDPWGITYTVEAAVSVLHVAWQDGQGDDADIYYSYAPYDHFEPDPCPWPYDFCFEEPQEISGYAINSDYVRPPDDNLPWSIEPSWQGQVSLELVPDRLKPIPEYRDWTQTNCLLASSDVYSKGVMIAWSDARSYDDWRYEIHVRRVASPEGDPMSYVACERPYDVGMLNSNAKLYPYRDDPDDSSGVARLDPQYALYQPAAVRQSNPVIRVDGEKIYVAWDDDRWDEPLKPGTVRNRDVFVARMASRLEETAEAYISPVFDSNTDDPKWYVLSWWGATQHLGDLLFQTRFGNNPYPPQDNVAASSWTKWTGNPSGWYLGCLAGEDCYYDAPGRHIVDPDGDDWFDCSGPTCPGPYRYMQYKVIIRGVDPMRLTAVSQITIHYQGPFRAYLPIVFKDYAAPAP